MMADLFDFIFRLAFLLAAPVLLLVTWCAGVLCGLSLALVFSALRRAERRNYGVPSREGEP